MRDLLKFLLVGMLIFVTPQVFAENCKVLIIPDNIVTESVALDSYIYDAAAEFFADEIITILNTTDQITAPSVSETRKLYKKNVSDLLEMKRLTSKFKTSYNIDYVTLQKLAKKANIRHVVLITSFIDSENYILRRTLWDFLNIPGATVIDPAYKISTYAVLIDTNSNKTLWSNTYYKTISVCENRIITRGQSPQSEQLQKIRDYSRNLCPQIAQNIQINVLPDYILAKETKHIDYDIGTLDNVFTKKYRQYFKSCDKKNKQWKENRAKKKAANEQTRLEQRQTEQKTELEVKAQPVQENSVELDNKATNISKQDKNIQQINYKNSVIIDVKQSRTNSLINNTKYAQPTLRDYSK